MLAITRCRLIDLYRDRRIRDQEVAEPDRLETFAVAKPDSGSLVAYFWEWLGRATEALPPKQREALHLVKLRESACRSGQSGGAIKANVHRGVRTLHAMAAAACPLPIAKWSCSDVLRSLTDVRA